MKNSIIVENLSKNYSENKAVEKIPNKGLGKTINDRLNRASQY